ncbi:MAG TPA: DUF177 domain-containing protein [Xanthobacteraceae bacterium]|nr:DUF177 domain-containing protein [Xanthobacteraceae bacterium]
MTDLPHAPRRQSPWSIPIRFEDVPETGRHVDLQADEHTRAELAHFVSVQVVASAAASFDVSRHGRDGLRVTGEVRARVGQICVVTLEPLESEIVEAVDVVFRPTGEPNSDGEDAEEDEDEPEPLVDGMADLGALATEFLILGIDPYPRKPGAVFESPAAGNPQDGPFAALAKLKGGGGERK